MEMDVAVFLEPALVVLVRVEIVDNDVKLATREGGNDTVQVSRPGIFTSGLSQNRARDSRLTRLPSGKHTGHTEPPVHEEMRALPCQLL